MLEIVVAECWRGEESCLEIICIWVSVWPPGLYLLLQWEMVVQWPSSAPTSCVVSCYQPQSFSGDTFLMFYLPAGVETRVANTSDNPHQEQSAPSQKVVQYNEKMKDYFSFLFNWNKILVWAGRERKRRSGEHLDKNWSDLQYQTLHQYSDLL